MSLKPQRLFAKAIIALIVAVVVFAPIKAFAFNTSDLLIATRDAEALCETGDYDWACGPARQYRKVLTEALEKPADQRDAYIEDALFTQEKTTTYLDVVSGYNKAAADGKIDTSNAEAEQGTCGGVQLSIKVDCGNAKNPIYGYLRGVIIFMGGAIGLAVVITIIVSGIQYSSSAGNPANITKAKERLTNAVIGLVLYLFLAAILRYLVPQIFT